MKSQFTCIAFAAILISQVAAVSKRGIAWPYFEKYDVSTFYANGKVGWVYDYEKYKPTGGPVPNGMEFDVMQRVDDSSIGQLASAAAQNGPYVLGFNEPDNAGQANLSPQQAASLWKQYFEPLRSQGKKLVAPAITSSSNQGQGLSWLDEFVAACSGCHFDAYAFHPYASNADAVQGSVNYFVNYKNGAYTPAWITEFGRSPDTVSNAGGAQFIQSVINYLDSEPRVQRYAYLARFDPNSVNVQRDLQNADGSKTALGNVYVS
ncbi:uncharacterized protein FA14DRAFT_160062 [Meira miltonrushii]|uniref:Asl1-like glycosyl hydrolase catalytic domain-containing protein n=1 Tax=Meira miltonrushii TaxID=1280837 RepID=A0A316VM46_9BASI|nr:uncharacterized protein FA14DRAFT_160062 [Meira miltonrushii]PWN38607.1 hypothetical protein FA14DRAFT_160062 [Meira miltonrushii]